MISNKIDAIRDGTLSIVDIENIVPEDMLKLSSGDMIPADIILLEKDLNVLEEGVIKGHIKHLL